MSLAEFQAQVDAVQLFLAVLLVFLVPSSAAWLVQRNQRKHERRLQDTLFTNFLQEQWGQAVRTDTEVTPDLWCAPAELKLKEPIVIKIGQEDDYAGWVHYLKDLEQGEDYDSTFLN